MRLGKVSDVDEVADGSAIGSGMVISVELEGGSFFEGGKEGERDEVRLMVVGLSDLGQRVGAGGIKIPERCKPELKIFEHLFYDKFGFAVDVDWMARLAGSDGHFFGVAVDGGRA